MERKIKLFVLFLLVIIGCIAATESVFAAAPPNTIFYQGRITDDTGIPLNGTYDVQFTLYDAETGGNSVWTSGIFTRQFERGIFSVYLGSQNSLSGLNFGQKYWLEMAVNDGSGWNVFSPRSELTAVPYAFNAYHVEGLKLSEVDWGDLAIQTTDIHKEDVGLTDVQNINQANMDGNQLSWDSNAEEFNVQEGSGSDLDADMLDGYHASNSSGSIPISNGVLNENLNAEMIEGKTWSEIDWQHLAIQTTDIHKEDVGLTDVQNINQANMDGNQLSWDSNAEEFNVQEGSGSDLDADMLDGYHASNNPGDIPISNGQLNVNLNADMLDGEDGGYYKQNLADVLTVGNTFGSQNMDVEQKNIYFYDDNNSSNIELTTVPASGNGYGLAVRPTSDPPGSSPIFRVLSAAGSERFRVEQGNRTETSNLFHAAGSIQTGGHLYMNGGNINQGGVLNMDQHSNGRLVLPVGADKYAQ